MPEPIRILPDTLWRHKQSGAEVTVLGYANANAAVAYRNAKGALFCVDADKFRAAMEPAPGGDFFEFTGRAFPTGPKEMSICTPDERIGVVANIATEGPAEGLPPFNLKRDATYRVTIQEIP